MNSFVKIKLHYYIYVKLAMECKKMRSRLFSYWFSVYAENDDFLFLPQVVYDEEENENYAALIIRRDNPLFNDLVSEFTNTITLLNGKPD